MNTETRGNRKNEAQTQNKPETAIDASHAAKLEKIEKAYSSEPWWYDVRGFLILTFAYRSTLPNQVRLFSGNIGKKHLEVAIGSGTLLDIILKWRKVTRAPQSEITGFDYAPRMLAGAIRRFRKEKQLTLELGDVTALHYADSSFDTANVANALHCFPDIKAGFSEIHRVLKAQGTLAGNVLLFPKGNTLMDKLANRINQWGMKKGILYSPCRKETIERLLAETGFEITFSEVSGNCFNFVARKK